MGNRAWDMITVRNQMENALKGSYDAYKTGTLDPLKSKFSDYGSQIQGQMGSLMGDYDSITGGYDKFQSGTVDPLKNQMYGMMTDEGKRGYSEDVQNAMYGKQAEALTGAKSSYMKNLGRNLASMGLGGANSGARLANVNQYEKQHASGLREAARDVKLADAEAKRADLWNAVQGYGTAAGLEAQGLQGKTSALSSKGNVAANMMGLGLNALQGERDVAGMEAQNLRDEQSFWDSMASQSQAYSGVKNNESGFWKSFKNSFGGALGGFLGNPLSTMKPSGF
jgi:hypothetical protein